MTAPIGSVSAPSASVPAVPEVPRAQAGPECRRFAEILAEGRRDAPSAPTPAPPEPAGPLTAATSDGVGASARRTLTRLFADEKAVDRGLAAALGGREMSTQELIALQAKVIRYSQELDVASRLVEKATSAVKQTLQTQV